MNRQKLEREKLSYSARNADGYAQNVSLSQGMVVGGEGMCQGQNIASHGLVIPWMGSKHIKILVCAE